MKSFRQTLALCLALSTAHLSATNCHAQNFTSDVSVTTGSRPKVTLVQDTTLGHPARAYSMNVFDIGSNANAGWYLRDTTASTVPFWVQGSAPGFSLVISPQGRTGLGTIAPLTNLHGVSTAGPFTFRMEETSPLPNTWDVEGGGLGFDIRDVTAGTNPFTILPGAPTGSLFVNAVGSIGMGTTSGI